MERDGAVVRRVAMSGCGETRVCVDCREGRGYVRGALGKGGAALSYKGRGWTRLCLRIHFDFCG